MYTSNLVIPAERIEQRIVFLRKTKVMLSSDLARLYGVSVPTTCRFAGSVQVKEQRRECARDRPTDS